MPNFKIKAYIGDVPDGGCVPVFTIASPNQKGEDYYDTLAEAKESLLAQIKHLNSDQKLSVASIKRVTLKKLFAEHFAYLQYVLNWAELGGMNDKYENVEDEFGSHGEIVKA